MLGRIEPPPSNEERAAIEAAILVLSSTRGDAAKVPGRRKRRWGDLAIAPNMADKTGAGWARVARLEALESLV
jgi:hypothetical protein